MRVIEALPPVSSAKELTAPTMVKQNSNGATRRTATWGVAAFHYSVCDPLDSFSDFVHVVKFSNEVRRLMEDWPAWVAGQVKVGARVS